MEEISDCFKALGDPLRLRILQLLPDEEAACGCCNVSQLAEDLDTPQPTVSHHLKILKQAGVVRCCKKCRDVYYWIDRRALQGRLDQLLQEIIPHEHE